MDTQNYQSAFARDDGRNAARQTSGVEGLTSGDDQDALRSQRDKDRASRVHEQREAAKSEAQAQARGDAVRVSINAPHQATVRGNQIALTIVPQDQPAGNEVASDPSHPFKVTDASGEDFMGLALAKNSFLYTTTNLATPYTFTRSWADATAGDKFYLEITLDNTLAVTAADMLLDAGWDGYDDMFHVDSTDPDNPFVDKIRVLIAEIVASSDPRDGIAMGGLGTGNKIIQHWRNNILLFAYPDAAGVPTYLPMPFA